MKFWIFWGEGQGERFGTVRSRCWEYYSFELFHEEFPFLVT